jgi:calcineurin-like phosphoesterase family protein
MTTWFTSDLHLGHHNIIEYCNRPFASVAEMHEWLINEWNNTVAADDDVWVLGDVALGSIGRSLNAVKLLHGTLRLVAGNHDKPFRRDGAPRPVWEERYLEAGFTEVLHGAVPFDLTGTPVTLCHFPYVGDSRDTDRHETHRPVDDGGWLLHGHVHGRWLQRGRCIDVGVDAWGGRPVDVDTITALITAGPTDRGPLGWGTPVGERCNLLGR